VRLSAADIAALPLPVALFDRDGALLARSPEWSGGGLGTVAYRLPVATLSVGCDEQDADIAAVMTELLEEIRQAAAATEGAQRRRLDVLAGSLALVAGSVDLRPATTTDVLDHLTAVLAMNSSYPVEVARHRPGPVPDAAIIALALRQLAINARRHDDAARITLAIDPGPTFTLEWPGQPLGAGITAARHQADRGRWGLGFVRLACDALGAVYLAPATDGAGHVTSVLALDAGPRFRLPLACIRDGIVERASPAWDEETHRPPGTALPDRWRSVVDAAAATPGVVVRSGSVRVRQVGEVAWVAIPREGTADSARDVIRGLEHERELLDVPDPGATRINGLIGVIALLLGDPARVVTPRAFDGGYATACRALALPALGGRFNGARAPDPWLVAFLAERLAATVRNVRGCVELEVDPTRRRSALARRLADDRGIISLP